MRAVQGLALAGVGCDRCADIQGRNHFADDGLGFGQALRVDIHQRDMCVAQGVALQDIAHDITHEYRRTGADKGDLGGF